MRILSWCFLNGIFAVAMYFGLIKEVDGAENVALFFAWVHNVFSPFIMADTSIKELSERGRNVPVWANVGFDLTVTAAFVWFGYWVTGAFYFFGMACQEKAWILAKEQKKKAEA